MDMPGVGHGSRTAVLARDPASLACARSGLALAAQAHPQAPDGKPEAPNRRMPVTQVTNLVSLCMLRGRGLSFHQDPINFLNFHFINEKTTPSRAAFSF
jgi:hypothetical protein